MWTRSPIWGPGVRCLFQAEAHPGVWDSFNSARPGQDVSALQAKVRLAQPDLQTDGNLIQPWVLAPGPEMGSAVKGCAVPSSCWICGVTCCSRSEHGVEEQENDLVPALTMLYLSVHCAHRS